MSWVAASTATTTSTVATVRRSPRPAGQAIAITMAPTASCRPIIQRLVVPVRSTNGLQRNFRFHARWYNDVSPIADRLAPKCVNSCADIWWTIENGSPSAKYVEATHGDAPSLAPAPAGAATAG